MVAHACDPSSGEAEVGGGLRVQGQPGLHREPLSRLQKPPCLPVSAVLHKHILPAALVLYFQVELFTGD